MIQIDMPMPENCLDCPACNEYLLCSIPINGRGWGESDVSEFDQSRPEWCPMKEPNYSKNPNSSKQPEVVRCRDCKYSKRHNGSWHSGSENNFYFYECEKGVGYHGPTWFCADWERGDDE